MGRETYCGRTKVEKRWGSCASCGMKRNALQAKARVIATRDASRRALGLVAGGLEAAVSNLLTFQKQTPVQSPLQIARLALRCARYCPSPPTLSATTTACLPSSSPPLSALFIVL